MLMYPAVLAKGTAVRGSVEIFADGHRRRWGEIIKATSEDVVSEKTFKDFHGPGRSWGSTRTGESFSKE